MFLTVRTMEAGFSRLLGDENAYWPAVFIPTFEEWFLVTRTQSVDGQLSRETVEIAGPRNFLQFIDSLPHGARIQDVQLVSPGWMNKTNKWRMDELLEIRLAKSARTGSHYFYLLQGLRIYPTVSKRKFEAAEIVYLRTPE